MSATVADALKKIAVWLLTNKKVMKTVLGIVLGVILIIVMPIVAILGIFSGGVEIDTGRLHEMIAEQQTVSAERWAEVENAMKSAGYNAARIQEAKTLFVYVLYEYSEAADFTDKLVGCFEENQTDDELIDAVNAAFGTQINAADFSNIMASTRAAQIDISGYTDPETKNNLDLAQWAVEAEKAGWGYVYGTYGTVLDEGLLTSKIGQYPDEVGGHETFIRQNWLGRRTADCVGLIKGYGWYNAETGQTEIGANDMPDIGADTMYNNANEKGTIDTIPEILGLAVWHEGHIGVYIGNGEVVQAANTEAGVIRNSMTDTAWTHWLKIPYIHYLEETEENPSG